MKELHLEENQYREDRFGEFVTISVKGSLRTGRIIYAFMNGNNIITYNVRDDAGMCWQRTEDEFR